MRPIHVVLLAGLWCGCAHMPQQESHHVVEPDLSGLQRVTVLEFSGENGEAVATALADRLGESSFYTMVDSTELTPAVQPATFEPDRSASEEEIRRSAISAGVDGVIVGEILESRWEDRPLPERRFSLRLPNRGRRWSDRRTGETKPQRTRAATVSMNVSLIDPETGQAHLSRRISREFETVVRSGDDSGGEQLLNRLTQECLDEAVRMLAPSDGFGPEQLVRCDLWTRGRAEVRQGVRLAEQGDWLNAEEKWQQAVNTHPENHAALFNLAVAAARTGDYCAAEDLVMRALRIQHREPYARGLEQIRQRRVACDRLQEERAVKSLATADAFWE
jgi:hypothetical protein